jgi:hypothetical protein
MGEMSPCAELLILSNSHCRVLFNTAHFKNN